MLAIVNTTVEDLLHIDQGCHYEQANIEVVKGR